MDTDFRILRTWLENHDIDFWADDEFSDTPLSIIANLPVNVATNYGDDKERMLIAVEFNFDEKDHIYSVEFDNFMDFYCDTMELVSSNIITLGEGRNKIRLRLANY